MIPGHTAASTPPCCVMWRGQSNGFTLAGLGSSKRSVCLSGQTAALGDDSNRIKSNSRKFTSCLPPPAPSPLPQPFTRTHNPEDQAQDHVFCQGSPELCLFSLLYILSIFPHFLFCFFIPALSISKFLSPCCHQHILPCALLIFCSTNSAILVSPRWCSPACGHY